MIPVLTATDVRRQDAAAEARGISVDTLMRAAGAAVAQSASAMCGTTYGRRIVVVCGKGNNGGDGFVAARLLARRGAAVTVVLVAGEPKGAALRALRAFDGPVRGLESLEKLLAGADLAIDAVLGVGVTRAPEGPVGEAVRALAAAPCPVLSVDVPSGLDADTGAVYGDAVKAWHTVTFTGFKPGLLFASGAELAGLIEVAGIGIPDGLTSGTAVAFEDLDVRALLPERSIDANKYRSGVALVIAGSRAMPGAAALVCGAAVHAGAGLVMLASTQTVCALAVGHVPEIVTVPLDDGPEGVLDEKGIEAIQDRLPKARALAIGPGLSSHPATQEAIRRIVRDARVPFVLDADGLNAFEGRAEELAAIGAHAVLTPHEGEFRKLAGKPVEDRLADALALAQRTGCTVLLKGYGSVVAGPDGRLAVNATGGPNLASAGTGDVLTGIITALLARGLPPFEAAAAGAHLHGTAADVLAPHVPNASAVIEAIGPVMGSLR